MKQLLMTIIVTIICCTTVLTNGIHEQQQEIQAEIISEPKEETIENPAIQPEESAEILMEVSWYTANDFSMDGNGITASGTQAVAGRTIAASADYPLGTQMVINGQTYVVEDRGGYITGNRLDVFEDSVETAVNNGRQMISVVVIRRD